MLMFSWLMMFECRIKFTAMARRIKTVLRKPFPGFCIKSESEVSHPWCFAYFASSADDGACFCINLFFIRKDIRRARNQPPHLTFNILLHIFTTDISNI